MKLKSIFYILSLGVGFASLSSCEKDLNALPSQSVVEIVRRSR
jgi:hypothetical protein